MRIRDPLDPFPHSIAARAILQGTTPPQTAIESDNVKFWVEKHLLVRVRPQGRLFCSVMML